MLFIYTLYSTEGSKRQTDTKWTHLQRLFESVLILVQQINNLELNGLNVWLRHIVNSFFESL